jgi:hypothetical protein
MSFFWDHAEVFKSHLFFHQVRVSDASHGVRITPTMPQKQEEMKNEEFQLKYL